MLIPLIALCRQKGISNVFRSREIRGTRLSHLICPYSNSAKTDVHVGSRGVDVGTNGFISGTIAKDGVGMEIGQYAEVHRIFKPNEVNQYASLIGDHNPIHKVRTGDQISMQQQQPQIVHGMLAASIFSSIFGTLIPYSVYRSQKLNFHSPVYSDETVVGIIHVRKIRDLKRRGLLLTCDTNIFKNCGETAVDIEHNQDAISCVSGEATVWLPGKTTQK